MLLWGKRNWTEALLDNIIKWTSGWGKWEELYQISSIDLLFNAINQINRKKKKSRSVLIYGSIHQENRLKSIKIDSNRFGSIKIDSNRFGSLESIWIGFPFVDIDPNRFSKSKPVQFWSIWTEFLASGVRVRQGFRFDIGNEGNIQQYESEDWPWRRHSLAQTCPEASSSSGKNSEASPKERFHDMN